MVIGKQARERATGRCREGPSRLRRGSGRLQGSSGLSVSEELERLWRRHRDRTWADVSKEYGQSFHLEALPGVLIGVFPPQSVVRG